MKVTENKTILVCQRGARHRYAIPRLLEDASALAALYTDSCAYSRLGRIATGLRKLNIRHSSIGALASRIPREIPKNKIFSADRPLLRLPFQQGIEVDYQRWGLQGACVVYSMYGEDLDCLEWAKAQGAKIIIDVFVHPDTNRIVSMEESKIHGISQSNSIATENEPSRRAFELADLLLCPSQWVADGTRECFPTCQKKIRLIPYGSSLPLQNSINPSPIDGRILFAGRDPLRKGLHYLADAAKRVREAGFEIDVRAAGIQQNEIGWMANGGEINCLGTLPMDQMRAEFRQAEIFVLPSLSEGQAGVVLEAMASGCAVIATRESGIDFESGCGITVPVRDAAALAEALIGVLKSRDQRNTLAEGALRQAALFSMDAWKSRLVQIVNEVSE